MVDPRIGRIERYYNCKFAKEYIEKKEKIEADRARFEAFEGELMASCGLRAPVERSGQDG